MWHAGIGLGVFIGVLRRWQVKLAMASSTCRDPVELDVFRKERKCVYQNCHCMHAYRKTLNDRKSHIPIPKSRAQPSPRLQCPRPRYPPPLNTVDPKQTANPFPYPLVSPASSKQHVSLHSRFRHCHVQTRLTFG